jgi:hypothetical protein
MRMPAHAMCACAQAMCMAKPALCMAAHAWFAPAHCVCAPAPGQCAPAPAGREEGKSRPISTKPETSRAREKRATPPRGTRGTKLQFVQARSGRTGLRIYFTAKCAEHAKSVLAASRGDSCGSRFGIRVQPWLTVANNQFQFF